MKVKILAGAAAVAALMATPTLAQTQQQQFVGQQYQPADPTDARQANRMRQSRAGERRARYNERRSGFGPGEVAAGAVGGAVGTAGAIATAPFTQSRSDSYAYDRGTTTRPNARYRAVDTTGTRSVRESRALYDPEPRSGFGPADAAAGVVGGAIGTAGAIATAPFAPFRGDSYAYDRGTTMPNARYRAVNTTGARSVRESRALYDPEPRSSGFGPADVAAGVVGGAIGAAGAIATAPFAPFRGDSYAYYGGTSTMPNRGYVAQPFGPTCVPGSITIINGQPMPCQ